MLLTQPTGHLKIRLVLPRESARQLRFFVDDVEAVLEEEGFLITRNEET
jgi:hypothetical protein